MLDTPAAEKFVNAKWDEEIVPELIEYIKVPNKSPMFDPDWEAHGYMDQVAEQFRAWCAKQPVNGMSVEVLRKPGRTPMLLVEIPGTGPGCVLLYGHMDKQPEMTGWDEGLGPWTPVLRDGRLYGRGGADDGYACFASLTAIMALQQQGIGHSRCVMLIEACEESGSPDLPEWVDELAERIGSPDLVICLDSGAGNYDQMWLTTSLRGMMAGVLRVEILTEGVHSGDASGIVPSSWRILNRVIARMEDPATGRLKPEWLYSEIPGERIDQAAAAAEVLRNEVWTKYPFVEAAQPMDENRLELILNRTWRPSLSFTGMDGMPPLSAAGNVLRPFTSVALSFRFPPTLDSAAVAERIKAQLESEPPYGAKVTFTPQKAADGWNAPPLAAWLEQAVNNASRAVFGKPSICMGEGGSIPFMGMLGEKFPDAQFVVTGVLGPASNAHGPNEFLHLSFGKKLTTVVARILESHHKNEGRKAA